MAKAARQNRTPIMLSDDEVAAIDEWRYSNRIATRSDAIRRLCLNALWLEEDTQRIAQQCERLYDLLSERLEQESAEWRLIARSLAVDSEVGLAHQRRMDTTRALLDAAYVLLLDTADMNNRVVLMTDAPNVRRGKAEVRKASEAIAELRKRYLGAADQAEENRLLLVAILAMTEDEIEAYRSFDDDQAEAFLDAKVEAVRHTAPPEGMDSEAAHEDILRRLRRMNKTEEQDK